MSHGRDKAPGAATVTPAPALSSGKKQHCNSGSYAKGYSRESHEKSKVVQVRPLQPPQEPLRQVNFNAAAVSLSTEPPLRSFPPHGPAGQDLSPPSSADCNDSEVDVSPLTTPSQSYVPKHRRLQGGHHVRAVQQHDDPTALPEHLRATLSKDSNGKLLQNHATGKENMSVGHHAASSSDDTTTASAASRQSAPKPMSAAEVKQRTASSTPHAVTSAASTSTATDFCRSASGLAPPRPLPLSSATAAPRQPPVPSTLTTGATRRGGAMGARAPQKRHASVKARPLASTVRKPTPSLTNDAAEKTERHASPAPTPTAAADRGRQPDVDAATRYQLLQMESVLDYVAEVVTALGERRRCAAPPQSTKGFRASVVPTRRYEGTSTSSEVLDGRDFDVPDHTEHVSNSGGTVAFLPDIHQAATRLLSAFTKLEYVQLSEDVDMLLLERDAVEYSAQLLRLVDGVERQLSLHEDTLVRRRLAERRYIFRAMHQLVHFIVRMTHEVVLLRDLALRHDYRQVLEAWGSFRAGVETQAKTAAYARDSDALDKSEDAATSSAPPTPQKSLIFPASMVRGSAFFLWLEGRWFPAMRQWRKLVVDAFQVAKSGDIEGAIRRSRQEALRTDGLEEILRPGETITTLLRKQVEEPIKEFGKAFSIKQATMGALREVLESAEAPDSTLSATELSKALKAAQAFTSVRSGRGSGDGKLSSNVGGDKEDAELVSRAEELLARLEEADVLYRAIKAALQHPAPELVTLLEHITRANELLLIWRCAHDMTSAQTALTAGRAALDAYAQRLHSGRASANPSSLGSTYGEPATGNCITPSCTSSGSPASPVPWIGYGFPASFEVRALCVTHRIGCPWPKHLSMAYMELCEVFGMLYAQRQARRDLEVALGRTAVEDHGTRLAIGLSLSPQLTPLRSTREAMSPVDTLRVNDEGSNAHSSKLPCSPGGTLETLASEGSSPPAQTALKGASAEELHRCIQQAEEAGVGGQLIEEARARLRLMDTLRLKIHFDAQTRVLPVADAAQASFCDVYKHIQEFCQAQQQQQQRSAGAERRLRIRYEDADGDFISLLEQQDWHMMLSELAPHGCGGVKIELFCDYPTVPGVVSNSMDVPNDDEVQRTGVASELAGAGFQTETSPETRAPGGPAGTPAAAPAATPEKRTNVFKRLAAAPKGSAAAMAAGGQRKPRIHPHSLGAPSPQQALLLPRNHASGAGGVRSVSPQKGGAACRVAVGAGSARGKGPSSSTTTDAASPKTAALTAENLRRNLLYPQAPSSPQGVEAAAQEEVRQSGERPSNDEMDTAARPAATSTEAPSPAADAHNSVSASNANSNREQESSAVHVNLDMNRRWAMPSDDELQMLEIQTRASVSTVCPDRCTSIPESAMTTVSRPTDLPSRAGPARNTFTATYCSGKVECANERGSGNVVGAVSDEGVPSKAPSRCLPGSPSQPPRRWASDAFSLDDVETVCSERSRVPQQAPTPKGPTSLPPRPMNTGGGGGTTTPQRVRRGARGTPTCSNAGAGDEDCEGGQGDRPKTTDILFEMQRMREANSRAMTQRKPFGY